MNDKCVTFCKTAFMSKVDPCGRALDAGKRQLGKVNFICSYHTLGQKQTKSIFFFFATEPIFISWQYFSYKVL